MFAKRSVLIASSPAANSWSQYRNFSSGAPRTIGIRHPWSDLLGRRAHNSLVMPTLPPLLASEP